MTKPNKHTHTKSIEMNYCMIKITDLNFQRTILSCILVFQYITVEALSTDDALETKNSFMIKTLPELYLPGIIMILKKTPSALL